MKEGGTVEKGKEIYSGLRPVYQYFLLPTLLHSSSS